MNSIIVDDDLMSIKAIKHLVSQISYINLIGVCSSPKDAIQFLDNNKVDLIFLDVEMPDMSGLELLKGLQDRPLTILTTSKKEYALEAFEYNVTDYLLKPVTLDRFFKAVAKVKAEFDKINNSEKKKLNSQFVYVKDNGSFIKVDVREILWIEAQGDYISINTKDNKRYTIHSTMKSIESKLDDSLFMRVHRSYIISLENITLIDDNVVMLAKQPIPIGAVYKENLMKHIDLL